MACDTRTRKPFLAGTSEARTLFSLKPGHADAPPLHGFPKSSFEAGGFTSVFIVQGKPRKSGGIIKVVKETRQESLQAAKDFIDQGFPFVSIIGDGHVYTVDEFATTIINVQPQGQPQPETDLPLVTE
jgi:hypothetical protein